MLRGNSEAGGTYMPLSVRHARVVLVCWVEGVVAVHAVGEGHGGQERQHKQPRWHGDGHGSVSRWWRAKHKDAMNNGQSEDGSRSR